MRVLWISCRCSLQERGGNPGLTARHENIMKMYGGGRIKLAVAFMADRTHNVFTEKDGVSYYPVHSSMDIGAEEEEWETASSELLHIIADFRPDVIQCFGAEWPYGLIAEKTDMTIVLLSTSRLIRPMNIRMVKLRTR